MDDEKRVDADLNDGQIQLRGVDQKTVDSAKAALKRGKEASEGRITDGRVDPRPLTEEITAKQEAAAATPLPIPFWVRYVWWPIVKRWRLWRGFCQRVDIAVKIGICRWLGIVDSFGMAKSVDHGLRQDLDKVAAATGNMVPVVNLHSELLKDLRILHNRELVAMANRRKREKEEEKPQ